MHRLIHRFYTLIACLLLIDLAGAAAAQQIPSSVSPGRERDRFTQSPVERFMQVGPSQPPSVVELRTNGECEPRKPHRSKLQARRRC